MLPSSAQPSTSKRYAGTTAIECGVGPSTSGTWCSTSSRATRTATSSLRHRRDHMSSRRCFDQVPTSSRPSTVKSLSMSGTSSSYVAFTLNKHTFSYQFHYRTPRPLVTPDPSNGERSGLTRGLIRAYLSGRHSLRSTLSHAKTQKRGLRK